MGRIFYLLGKSASGKDSLYHELIQDESLQLNSVVLYTTRPMRTGETEGVEYHFIDEDQVRCIEEQGRMIELRAYNTVHGVWKYMTVQDEMLSLDRGDYLMAGTLESYISIRNYFGAEAVEPFYIYVDDGVRLERALARERSQAEPKYAEMCRRFLADEADYTEEKLTAGGITERNRVENADFAECVEELKRRILTVAKVGE